MPTLSRATSAATLTTGSLSLRGVVLLCRLKERALFGSENERFCSLLLPLNPRVGFACSVLPICSGLASWAAANPFLGFGRLQYGQYCASAETSVSQRGQVKDMRFSSG